MIQDIAPKRYKNTYRPAPAKSGDYLLCYQDRKDSDQKRGWKDSVSHHCRCKGRRPEVSVFH